MGSSNFLSVERRGAVALMTAERPAVLNALNPPMLDALVGTLGELSQDESVGAVVLTGAGRSFMAGADVKAMAEMSPGEFRAFVEGIQELTRMIRGMSVPVVAAIGGVAVGAGCEIACACDVRVASTEASFGFPEVRLGLVATSGATYLLPRIVGRGWARYLQLVGESITADEAARIGLVQVVTAPDTLLETASRLAAKIAERPRLAVALSRRLLEAGEEGSLESSLRLEVEAILSCLTEGEAREGLKAFLEKRDPRYRQESAR